MFVILTQDDGWAELTMGGGGGGGGGWSSGVNVHRMMGGLAQVLMYTR